jgi:hypothetical protein
MATTSSENGKPIVRWGHKATGPKFNDETDGWVAGDKKILED